MYLMALCNPFHRVPGSGIGGSSGGGGEEGAEAEKVRDGPARFANVTRLRKESSLDFWLAECITLHT